MKHRARLKAIQKATQNKAGAVGRPIQTISNEAHERSIDALAAALDCQRNDALLWLKTVSEQVNL